MLHDNAYSDNLNVVIPPNAQPIDTYSIPSDYVEPMVDVNDLSPKARYSVWHLRVDSLSDHELELLKQFAHLQCVELAIGVPELGGSSNQTHHHCHFYLSQSRSLKSLSVLLADVIGNRIHPHSYYLAPALHYFNPTLHFHHNYKYCTKNGILYSFIATRDLVDVASDNASNPRAVKRRRPVSVMGSNFMDRTVDNGNAIDLDNDPAFDPALNFSLPLDSDLDGIREFAVLDKNQRLKIAKAFLSSKSIVCGGLPKIALYELAHEHLGHNVAKALFSELYHRTEALSVRKSNPSSSTNIEYPSPAEQEVWWITGPPGAGKTTFLRLLFPGAYTKNKDCAYWESYRYQDHTVDNPHMCVVFNELDTPQDILNFSPNKASFDTFKNMLDSFPFPIEIKHKAQEMIRPRRIMITSNTTVTHILNDVEALSRRLESNNKYYGINVTALSGAINRRVTTIDIADVLTTYRCFCIPKDRELCFGGVFHMSLREEIRTVLRERVLEYSNSTDPLKLVQLLRDINVLRADWELRTVELLREYRWIPYEVVYRANSLMGQDNVFDPNAIIGRIDRF